MSIKALHGVLAIITGKVAPVVKTQICCFHILCWVMSFITYAKYISGFYSFTSNWEHPEDSSKVSSALSTRSVSSASSSSSFISSVTSLITSKSLITAWLLAGQLTQGLVPWGGPIWCIILGRLLIVLVVVTSEGFRLEKVIAEVALATTV